MVIRLLVLVVCLGLAGPADAQITNPYGVPDAWANAGVDIPTRNTICATIEASTYNNGKDEASNGIEAAIAACGVGEVVKLGHGRFRINDAIHITRSNVTLRGSGMRLGNWGTLLEKNNKEEDEHIILIGSTEFANPDETTDVDLTVDAAAGDTTITVTNAVGFVAGQFVKIDADEWNVGAGWIDASPLKNGTPYQVWGTDRVRYKIRNPSTNDMCVIASCNSIDDYSRHGRVITEFKEVASVVADGVGGAPDTITFTMPLMIAFPVAKLSQVIRYTGTSVHNQGVGVEDLSMTGGTGGTLRVTSTAKSWARNVECRNFLSPCVDIFDAYKFEFRDGYVHSAYNPLPGGGAYAFSIRDGGGSVLFENNIVRFANKLIVGRASGAGSVYSYNYATDSLIIYDPLFQEVGINASHYPAPHHWLFEGNQSQNYDSDFTFGSSIDMTIFRNWLEGERATLPTQMGRSYRTVGLMEGSLNHAFFGNILGRPVFVLPESDWVYEDFCDGTTTAGQIACNVSHAAIWRLGYSSINAQLGDADVHDSMIRDGNWDYLTDSQHWHDHSATTIEDSLYLTEKPPFFSTSQVWPWVDPTTGTTHVLPAKLRYDGIAQWKRHRLRMR